MLRGRWLSGRPRASGRRGKVKLSAFRQRRGVEVLDFSANDDVAGAVVSDGRLYEPHRLGGVRVIVSLGERDEGLVARGPADVDDGAGGDGRAGLVADEDFEVLRDSHARGEFLLDEGRGRQRGVIVPEGCGRAARVAREQGGVKRGVGQQDGRVEGRGLDGRVGEGDARRGLDRELTVARMVKGQEGRP